MTIEKKNATGNNGYPATIYGAADSGDVDKYGSKVGGSGLQREYTYEIGVEIGKDLEAAQSPLLGVLLPEGYVVAETKLFAEEAFDGAISVGLVPESGTGEDADALFAAASAPVGVTPGTPSGPAAANTPLDQDYYPVVSIAGTAGKGKLIVKLEVA